MTSTRASYPGDPNIAPRGQQLPSDLHPAFCSLALDVKQKPLTSQCQRGVSMGEVTCFL